MKNKKMFLWIALIVMAIIPVWAQQYDSEKDFQIDWDDNVNGGVKIVQYLGTKKEVSIPPSIQNKPVTGISGNAFSSNKNITKVTIPNSVTRIFDGGEYDGAFSNCTSLTIVTIPDSVVNIGRNAFKNCTSLKSVNIPNSVTNIGGGAFSSTKLTSVNIPSNVKTINGKYRDRGEDRGSGAFENCTSLTSVTIENGVPMIGWAAFKGCTSLPSITIPNSVTIIGDEAFSGCTFTSVVIPNGVTSIGSSAFSDCTNLTSVTIPDSVTSIGNSAFENCTELISITIPKNVDIIRYRAFYGCYSLTSVTFQCTLNDGNFSFFPDDSYKRSVFPGDLRNKYFANDGGPGIYERFAGGNVWKKTQSITPPPTSAAATSAVSVEGTPGLEYLLFNNDKEYAVSAGTRGRTAVVIPAMYNNLPVTRIKKEGFLSYNSLNDITIPNSVISIGSGAFAQCKGFTSITIPNSVISIESGAFRGCDNLTSVTFQGYITANNFSSTFNFPYDLRDKYLAGGPGTYTRPNAKGRTWTKQP